jgi:hypothetical protein
MTMLDFAGHYQKLGSPVSQMLPSGRYTMFALTAVFAGAVLAFFT